MNIETIRYYERIKLMPCPSRTRAGRRAFSTEQCRTLSFIKRGRELGFSISDIRTLLSLRHSDTPCKQAKAVAERHLEAVQSKMRDLLTLEKALSDAIGRCAGDLSAHCAVLETLNTKCCQVSSNSCCGA